MPESLLRQSGAFSSNSQGITPGKRQHRCTHPVRGGLPIDAELIGIQPTPGLVIGGVHSPGCDPGYLKVIPPVSIGLSTSRLSGQAFRFR